MDTFFETIRGKEKAFSTLHTRVWEHPGAVVDLGCLAWDWPACFLGKKRVIGVDPDLSVPPIAGAELMQCCIGPYNGMISFQGGSGFNISESVPQHVPMWTWKRFAKANIDSKGIAALKINIEGGEYPLLASMDEVDFNSIDQLAVSFHDFCWPHMAKSSKAIIGYLEDIGYTSRQTYKPFNWWLFT